MDKNITIGKTYVGVTIVAPNKTNIKEKSAVISVKEAAKTL